MNSVKIGVIGKGFVGSALSNGFNDYVEQHVVDPRLTDNTIKSLIEFDPSVIFICVPTPKCDSHMDVDVSTVRSIVTEIASFAYRGVVTIKNTITPNHLTKLKKDFDLKLVYNPEFLTEANSFDDFLNPHMQILGGKWKDCEVLDKLYTRHSKVKIVPIYKVDLVTASLIKYSINSWLAMKVTFFNELYELHKSSGAITTWEQFTTMLSTDPRIGKSHMQVPGPDGGFGFGGHCFPKDVSALIYYAKGQKVKLDLLSKSLKVNDTLRTKS